MSAHGDVMTMMVDAINCYLKKSGDGHLSVSYERDTDDFWCFCVHGHSAWKGVSECERLSEVKLNSRTTLNASWPRWTNGYHGTTTSNMLLIMSTGNFNITYSGDEIACVCLTNTLKRTGSYEYGAVLQCDIVGFMHPLEGTEAHEDLTEWSAAIQPIGMNSKNKNKGSKGGQVAAHPANLCIKQVYIRKTVNIPALLATDLQPEAGACFKRSVKNRDKQLAKIQAGILAQASFEEHLQKESGVWKAPAPRDLRDLVKMLGSPDVQTRVVQMPRRAPRKLHTGYYDPNELTSGPTCLDIRPFVASSDHLKSCPGSR